MPIVLRGGSSTVNTSGSASLVMTKPAGTAAGDLILIWCFAGFPAITFTDTPDGFTAVTAASGTSWSQQLLWKFASGSEGSTLTVTASASHVNGAIIAVYENVIAFDPAPAAGSSATSTSAITAPSITPVNAGDQLVWCGGTSQLSATGAPTLSPPAGYVTRVAQANSGPGTGTQYVSILMADLGGAPAGATGTVAGSSSPSEAATGAMLVSLQAAVAASLTGTGVLTAQPVVNFLATATLSGAGALAAQPVVNFASAAALSGTGSLTAQPVVNFVAAASLSGSGLLTAQPVVNFLPLASLTGAGLLTSQPLVNFLPTAALSGSGLLTSQPVVNFLVTASLSGLGVLTATAQTSGNVTAAATLTGTGTLISAALVNFLAAASLSGTGVLTAAAVVGHPTAAFVLVAGVPLTQWETGALAALWAAGVPASAWEPGEPVTEWQAGTVTTDWQDS